METLIYVPCQHNDVYKCNLRDWLVFSYISSHLLRLASVPEIKDDNLPHFLDVCWQLSNAWSKDDIKAQWK